MSRASYLLNRLGDIKERNLIAEQDDEEETDDDDYEDDEEEDDEEEGDESPFSKRNRNSDGSMKTGDKTPINDKKKRR